MFTKTAFESIDVSMLRILTILFASVAMALPGSAQLLYKVEGNGLASPSYIFGTHHRVPLSVLDSVPSWKSAFDGSRQVVGEVDLSGGQMSVAMRMQPYMMAPVDSTLSKVLSKEDYARASREFKKIVPDNMLDLSTLDMLKPQSISALVTKVIYDKDINPQESQEQLDSYFQSLARERGKTIVGLESVEQQAELLFCTRPIKDQTESLLEILDNPEELAEEAAKLTDSYMKQDLGALLEISEKEKENDESAKNFFHLVLDKRNADWISKLPGIMAEAPSFIAVGALHLAGDKGIVEGLRDKGFTVTPIIK